MWSRLTLMNQSYKQRQFFYTCQEVISPFPLLFIDELALATKSLTCLLTNHSSYPKSSYIKERFLEYWKSLSEDKRKEALGKDEKVKKSILEEISQIEKETTKFEDYKNSIEHAREFIKYKAKFENEKDIASLEEIAI